MSNDVLGPFDPRNAGRIAFRLTRRDVTSGDIAELKRLDPRQPTSRVFWQVCGELNIDPKSYRLIRSWGVVVRIIAKGIKVGEKRTDGAHDGSVSLGMALANKGYSERRLKLLLAAKGDSVIPIVERMAGFLYSEGQKFNSSDMACLVLTEYRDGDHQSADRIRIARDYYGHPNKRGQEE